MSEKPDENRPLEDRQIVMATELQLLTFGPPKVAKLILHTLEGSEAFGLTDEIVEGLHEMLGLFLKSRPS